MGFFRLFSAGSLAMLLMTAASSGQTTKKNGELITPAANGERRYTFLRAGDDAPDFTLPLLKIKGEVKLSSFKDKSPVVLVFGSYT